MTQQFDVALVTAASAPAGIDRSFMTATDAPLVDALQRHGVHVAAPSWRDPESWERFDLVMVRTTWDYVERREEFLAWANGVEAVTRLCNSAEVIRWNTHKSYLLELEERGAPIVPTAWLAAGDRVELGTLLDERGWPHAVVKPAVDAGSRNLLRVDESTLAAGQAHLDRLLTRDDVLVQPYQSAVERRGELSVVVIEGEVSHAVRKRPGDGDFRVQHAYGGTYAEEPVSEELARLAGWIVAATGHELVVARVDLLEDESGAPLLAELEATEPDLYLGTVPAAAERLAEAVVRRLEA